MVNLVYLIDLYNNLIVQGQQYKYKD